MGGDYYDREVVSAGASSTGYSDVAAKNVGNTSSLHSSLDPKRWMEEALICDKANPIVFALDVTGSMGDWSKIIYDKMPMFYGQLMMQKYLVDPSISFCAVGDYTSDTAPLQIAEFGQGKEIDQLISKIFLEGNGGGGYSESYEFSAYFYLKRVDLQNSELPFFFITGDESFYDEISPQYIEKHIGLIEKNKVYSHDIWEGLKKKYNTFLIKKTYSTPNLEKIIKKQWIAALGEERVLYVKTPKACIDVILGAIALTSGSRTLDEYILDMKERGQSSDRLDEVLNALGLYWNKLKSNQASIVKTIKPVTIEDIKLLLPKLKEENFSHEEKTFSEQAIIVKDKVAEELLTDFLCPITQEIFINPVIAEDGNCYEKYAIEYWLTHGNIRTPLSPQPVPIKFIPNISLKKMIKNFVQKNL